MARSRGGEEAVLVEADGGTRIADLTQQRLAEYAECSLSMVRVVESGYGPKASQVLARIEAALARALDKSHDDAASCEAILAELGIPVSDLVGALGCGGNAAKPLPWWPPARPAADCVYEAGA